MPVYLYKYAEIYWVGQNVRYVLVIKWYEECSILESFEINRFCIVLQKRTCHIRVNFQQLYKKKK